jgi:hypothetical protein
LGGPKRYARAQLGDAARALLGTNGIGCGDAGRRRTGRHLTGPIGSANPSANPLGGSAAP